MAKVVRLGDLYGDLSSRDSHSPFILVCTKCHSVLCRALLPELDISGLSCPFCLTGSYLFVEVG